MPPPYPSLPFRRPDAAFPQRRFRGGGRMYTRRVVAAVLRFGLPPGPHPPGPLGVGVPPTTTVAESTTPCVRFGGPTPRCPRRRGGLEGDGGVPPPDAPDASYGHATRRNGAQWCATRYNVSRLGPSLQTRSRRNQTTTVCRRLNGVWPDGGARRAWASLFPIARGCIWVIGDTDRLGRLARKRGAA
jgi:hypothetical protein